MEIQLVYLGVPIALVIVALVQLAKMQGLSSRFSALMAVALGIIAGSIGLYATGEISNLFLGLLTGLGAAGLYSGAKATIEK